MKAIRFWACALAIALFAFAISLGSHAPVSVRAKNGSSASADPQTDSNTSLARGRSLLKQGHADQALPLLDNALSLYTQAKNQRGIAAARDALGDLYLIQGQYKIALDHYMSAYEAFAAASGGDQKTETAANTVASRAGATAAAATETAAS